MGLNIIFELNISFKLIIILTSQKIMKTNMHSP